MSVTTADIIMVVVITMDNTAAGTIMGIGTMARIITAGIIAIDAAVGDILAPYGWRRVKLSW